MRSQTKEHTEISAVDGLDLGEVQLATGRPRNEVLTDDRMLGAEVGPFCQVNESYESKNSQESF
jgi:hypothetical protein